MTALASPADFIDAQPASKQTVDIVLDPDVMAAMCRRGRRRLRDLNSSSQADLKLDRFRGVLQVTGSNADIADIRRQLEVVVGPCLAVNNDVWSELMRTRTNNDSTLAAVARIQEVSGCRVHIERTAKQIRLFGPKEEVCVARQLLDELDAMCTVEVVETKCPQDPDLEMLTSFAQEFGVTLQIEERQIVVLGIQGAVAPAAKELLGYVSDRQQFELDREEGKISEIAFSAIKQAMVDLKSDFVVKATTDGGNLSCNSTTDSLPPFQRDSHNCSTDNSDKTDNQMQGLVMCVPQTKQLEAPKAQDKKQQQMPFGVCSTCGSCGNFCVHCGKPSRKMMGQVGACNTCGAANFCMYCGKQTQKVPVSSTHQSGPPPSGQNHYMSKPADQNAMMPMACYQPDVGNTGAPMMQMPNGMMAMFVPAAQAPAAASMMQSPAMQPSGSMMQNGMQTFMVPMPYSFAQSYGFDVCC